MKRYVILISGRGSNMDALLDARLPGQCVAVISNRPEAAGLGIAQSRGIATHVLDHRGFSSRDAFDASLADLLEQQQPDLQSLRHSPLCRLNLCSPTPSRDFHLRQTALLRQELLRPPQSLVVQQRSLEQIQQPR